MGRFPTRASMVARRHWWSAVICRTWSDRLADARAYRCSEWRDCELRPQCPGPLANGRRRLDATSRPVLATFTHPTTVVSDHGTEPLGMVVLGKTARHRSRQTHARPGCDERLSSSLADAHEQIEALLHDDTHHRPRSELGTIPLAKFVSKKEVQPAPRILRSNPRTLRKFGRRPSLMAPKRSSRTARADRRPTGAVPADTGNAGPEFAFASAVPQIPSLMSCASNPMSSPEGDTADFVGTPEGPMAFVH